jgi:hypothetical protein
MADTLLQFPKSSPATAETPRETGVALSGTQPGPIEPFLEKRTSGALAVGVIEIDKLYPTSKESASALGEALTLLADSISMLGEARASMQQDDRVTSDRYVQRFQASLPTLFRPRGIGDGYAVVINSLHVAFINQRGKLLSFDQLTTVWRVLRALRNAPFIRFQEALHFVDEIEGCGLNVNPQIISELLEDSEPTTHE